MKNSRWHLIIFVFLTWVATTAEANSSKAKATMSPISGDSPLKKEFVYCAESGPQIFNPQLATDNATYNASSRTIYNRLVEFEHGGTRVVPSLAKSWAVSKDGKSVTFRLRDDIEFQTTDYFKPTRKMNADDVMFSFERMWDKNNKFHMIGGGKYPNFEGLQMKTLIKNIIRVNNTTVSFDLQRPEAPFLANMAMDFASILSKEYADQLVAKKKFENIDIYPIGTGPFVLNEYKKDKRIKYLAHSKYFLGPSKLDVLIFDITPDINARFQKILAGECHLISSPNPEIIEKAKKISNLKVMSQAGLNISYLAMNSAFKPLNSLEVRRAIHHALDRTNIIKRIYEGNAQIAKAPVPPTMWSYVRNLMDFGYDAKLAKKLLASAGFPNGFDIELWYSSLPRPYNPAPQLMAEMIRDNLGAIGIKVKLVDLPWQEFLARSRKGEPPISIQGWTSDNGDPDNFLNNLLSCNSVESGNNRARWCDQKFTFLVERARVTTNIRLRTQFYEEAQKIFKQHVPWVTISHATVFKILRSNVEGYRISPFGIDQFYYLDLSPIK
jgi:dipeptide transport system substrate-binding protein